jgi:hypothetical protein
MFRMSAVVMAKNCGTACTKIIKIQADPLAWCVRQSWDGDRVQSDHKAKLELKLLSNHYEKCCKVGS